jgi:hypothetical protein
MMFVLLILTIIFVFGPIAKAYAERLSREPGPGAIQSGPELARLREEVERLSLDVARLQDEQSFMVRLLSEGERKKLLEGRQNTE